MLNKFIVGTLSTLSFVFLLQLCLLSTELQAADRPNFVVILCDDLGYGDLECYGHPSIKTPHLNQLAEQGVRLTACYSSAPVCSSSRAGLLTGRTPTRIGIYDWIPGGHPMHVKASELTVAQLLKDAGYDTSHSGKWHCNGKFNSPAQPQPGDLGFNHWFSTQNNASPSHKNPKNFVRNGKNVGPLEGFSCQIVANEAIDWIKNKRDKAKPFFTFVCFHEPHEPIASPLELVESYPQADKRGQAEYFANVTNMDRAVGSLMQALEEEKLTDNTLVFFTSDNGPETLNRYGGAWRSHGSPGPLRGMKLHIYEGGIRVAGIMRFPGKIQPNTTSDTAVCGLDVLPTFCELGQAKLPTDRSLDGASFASMFDGQEIQREQPLFWHYYRSIGKPKVAIREGKWKLVAHLDLPKLNAGASMRKGDYQLIKSAKIGTFELYDLEKDLAETTDLVKQQPEVVQALSLKLKEKYQEVLSEAPDWNLLKK